MELCVALICVYGSKQKWRSRGQKSAMATHKYSGVSSFEVAVGAAAGTVAALGDPPTCESGEGESFFTDPPGGRF